MKAIIACFSLQPQGVHNQYRCPAGEAAAVEAAEQGIAERAASHSFLTAISSGEPARLVPLQVKQQQ